MASITQSIQLAHSPERIQSRLLMFASGFLGLYTLALTLAPAARARSWVVDLRWSHWIGYVVWMVIVVIADRQTRQRLPNRDPYLLPIGAMLSGWGMMTVWRLYPEFGARQTIWFAIAMAVLILGLRLPTHLHFLRRYKYLWLTSGLILTALTLLFGTNPASITGPRLWLGCCGVYFQPSEPLKLLLIVFMSAYLADAQPWARLDSPISLDSEDDETGGKKNGTRISSLTILSPILVMTSLALILLLVQRDLGTATIFVFLFTVVVYLATRRKYIILLSTILLAAAGIIGNILFDVVSLRIDAWLNPWIDPSGRSYQIVQSLLALANGGIGGRGPGMGSPTLVPISHSDFVFSAIVEESGLIGAIGLIVLLMLLTASGIRIAMGVPDNFRRYLAAGLTAYLVGQSILIIGGNIRLLPLTGVTLPYVSYGGSSLVTAFISLLLLLLISQSANTQPAQASNPKIYTSLGVFLLASLTAAALVIGWWTYVRGPALLERTDNARRGIADRYVERGEILDRNNIPLVTTEGAIGNYSRVYNFPELGSLIGYSHPVYGQSGLEASLDPYLRGLEGNSELSIWWNHILYGQPPPGLDTRLSLDFDLQHTAGDLIDDKVGGLVLLNASNGEILALASRPTFDPNKLGDTWLQLVNDADTPLLNRVIQGQYQPGPAIGQFILAALIAEGRVPQIAENYDLEQAGSNLGCAITPTGITWEKLMAAGCSNSQIILSQELKIEESLDLLDELGLFALPVLEQSGEDEPRRFVIRSLEELISGDSELWVSPLQMASAAAIFSSGGVRPVPQIATGVNLPDQGWTLFSPSVEQYQIFSQSNVEGIANSIADEHLPIWESISVSPNGLDEMITWYLAGTLPSWSGAPLSLVILLEENDALEARRIGKAMMEAALKVE
jgi:cell division protein FtsW (lipid II flippase)